MSSGRVSILGKVNDKLEMANQKMGDNDSAEEDSFCDCVRYFCFLIMFPVMCMCGRSLDDHNFWISNQFMYSVEEGTYGDMIDQSRLFTDLNEVEDIYIYFQQMAMPLLYVNYSYNSQTLTPEKRNFVH